MTPDDITLILDQLKDTQENREGDTFWAEEFLICYGGICRLDEASKQEIPVGLRWWALGIVAYEGKKMAELAKNGRTLDGWLDDAKELKSESHESDVTHLAYLMAKDLWDYLDEEELLKYAVEKLLPGHHYPDFLELVQWRSDNYELFLKYIREHIETQYSHFKGRTENIYGDPDMALTTLKYWVIFNT